MFSFVEFILMVKLEQVLNCIALILRGVSSISSTLVEINGVNKILYIFILSESTASEISIKVKQHLSEMVWKKNGTLQPS